MNLFMHKRMKPVAVLSWCSCIPLLQLMLEISMAIISSVLNTFHRQTLPMSQNVVTIRCVFVLFCTSLSGYALLNASQTAANNFDVK
jgi:hypothetical protein